MPKYRLARRFYDGETLHQSGEVLNFEEGEQPSSAYPYKGEETVPEKTYGKTSVSIEDAEAGATLSGMNKRGK